MCNQDQLNLFETPVEIKPKKEYNCIHCHAEKTVRWFNFAFTCSECGHIDRKRTEEAKANA